MKNLTIYPTVEFGVPDRLAENGYVAYNTKTADEVGEFGKELVQLVVPSRHALSPSPLKREGRVNSTWSQNYSHNRLVLSWSEGIVVSFNTMVWRFPGQKVLCCLLT